MVNTYMKRYIVFHGLDYYPSGGYWDSLGFFDSVEECCKAIESYYNKTEYLLGLDWWHILDCEMQELVLKEFIRDILVKRKEWEFEEDFRNLKEGYRGE